MNPVLSFALLIILAVVVALLWLGAENLRQASEYDATRALLSSSGREGDAEILSQRVAIRYATFVRRGEISRYYITFRLADHPDVTTEKQIVGQDYDALHVGDHIRVRYLPDQIATLQIVAGAREKETGDYLRSRGLFFIGAAGLTVIAVVLAFTTRRASTASANAQATVQSLQSLGTSLAP